LRFEYLFKSRLDFLQAENPNPMNKAPKMIFDFMIFD
jgi:hypothetical protein